MSMIEFRKVSKFYQRHTAVDGLNLHIEEGEFCVLVGPSGSGKTTSMKMMNGLVEPDIGDVYFKNRRIKDYDIRRLRHRIGYVLQQIALFPHMTVQQNIELIPDILGWTKRERQTRSMELLEMVGLDAGHYAARYPHELSGGEQQRIGILRAVAARPDLLLMDEPFSALDPVSRYALQEMVADIHRQTGTTVIFVTHNMQEAQRLADRIVVMRNGRLEQNGTPEEMRLNPATEFVRSFFCRDTASLGRVADAAAFGLLPFSQGAWPQVPLDAALETLFPLLAEYERVRTDGGEIDRPTVFACLQARNGGVQTA